MPKRNNYSPEIRVGVDVGGTFTDVVLLVGTEVTTAKVPTTDDQSEGAIRGIEKACRTAGIDTGEIGEFTHAMTVSVNALLERDGAETALVTTDGFGDVLEIGRQDRPSLYDLDAEKPAPLVPRRRRLEIEERTTVDGIETAVGDDEIRALVGDLTERNVGSVAVALLHAYADPSNERRVVEQLREHLDVPVSASHEVLPTFREYERTSTTVVDAYVRPAINDYLGRLTDRAAERGIPTPWIMQSNAGIGAVDVVRQDAVSTVLSGPAAGVVGAKTTAEATGGAGDGIVSFDMGGTSTDVSLVRDGETDRTTEAEIGGHPIGVPMVDVATIGSGGGSIARVDAGGALRVGPESAGADPGPACYGRGGTEPTVTDADLLLGYIGETATLGGEVELDVSRAETALSDLAADAGLDGPLAAAAGVARIANEQMARAIRSVTVERGHDPRTVGLVAFGGAGPVHAASVADRLGIETVIVPLAGGVLSAYGLLAADERQEAIRTHRERLHGIDPEEIEGICRELATEARRMLRNPEAATVSFVAELRYVGQSYELPVEVDTPKDLAEQSTTESAGWFDPERVRESFHTTHERTYGYRAEESVELVTLRASATVERSVGRTEYTPTVDPDQRQRTVRFGDRRAEATVLSRRGLEPGERIEGPVVLEQRESTTLVPPEWDGSVRGDGTIVLKRAER